MALVMPHVSTDQNAELVIWDGVEFG